MTTARFLRNGKSGIIHLTGCKYAVGNYVRPWRWAEDREIFFLRVVADAFGSRRCCFCDPFKEGDDADGTSV